MTIADANLDAAGWCSNDEAGQGKRDDAHGLSIHRNASPLCAAIAPSFRVLALQVLTIEGEDGGRVLHEDGGLADAVPSELKVVSVAHLRTGGKDGGRGEARDTSVRLLSAGSVDNVGCGAGQRRWSPHVHT
jgi:hypothetical protein